VADKGSSEPGQITALGPGRVILLVGASGAGKDAILLETRRRLASRTEFSFPRRVVTRQPGTAEDHDCVSICEFNARLEQGRFALAWQAHGLSYGIPVEIDVTVRHGGSVICNVSRTILARARARYRHLLVVLVEAPAELRAARITKRQREGGQDLALRLARATDFKRVDADLIIENAGALPAAAATLVDWLLAGGGAPRVPDCS
jgi:ribose 1,5-bisphosphokinase